MLKFFKNLEIEWKIFILAAIILTAFIFPLQSIYISKLKSTLNESIDNQLEPLLRSFLSENDSTNMVISSRLERDLQWQALIPIIIEEQSFAMILITLLLLVLLLFLSFLSLKHLTKPLKNLAVAAEKIGKGQTVSIVANEGGALGKLEKSMITMQNELSKLRERSHVQGMESAWREIARVMAHEIKNPLTPIQLTLDRIQDRFDRGSDLSKEDIIKFVDRISTQVNSLEKLVNNFRSFAKEPEPNLSHISLREFLIKVSSDFSGSVETVFRGNAVVNVDPFLLQRVILNIWKNSFEAGATKINVSIESISNTVALTISDNGSGIDPDNIERIWIPYVTFKKGGTGLGLPVVKRLLEAMGASIEMKSSVGTDDHGVATIIIFKSDFTDTTINNPAENSERA